MLLSTTDEDMLHNPHSTMPGEFNRWQHQPKASPRRYADWFRLSFLMEIVGELIPCVAASPPRLDDPFMLNIAILSEEENQERQAYTDYTSLGLMTENQTNHTYQTTKIDEINQETQSQTAKGPKCYGSSPDLKEVFEYMRSDTTAAEQIHTTENLVKKVRENVQELEANIADKPVKPMEIQQRTVSTAGQIIGRSKSMDRDDGSLWTELECAIDSCESLDHSPEFGTQVVKKTQLVQQTGGMVIDTASKPAPITFQKSPPTPRRTESLLSLSIREQQKHRSKSMTTAMRTSTRATAGNSVRMALERRTKSLDDEILRRQERASRVEKMKMDVLIEEAAKTAIPVYRDPRVDGAATARQMIEWMEEHDLDHLFPL